LEVVVDGPLALYARRGTPERFYLGQNDTTTELVKRQLYVPSDDAISTRHRYRQQLLNQMSGCKNVQADAQEASLDYQSLRHVVGAYNRCKSSASPIYVATDRDIEVAYGVTGGLVASNPTARGGMDLPYGDVTSYSFDWTAGFSLGVWTEFRLDGGYSPWSVNAELVLTSEWMKARPPREPTDVGSGIRITHRALRISALPRYYVQTGSWEPYVEAGLTATASLLFDDQKISSYYGTTPGTREQFLKSTDGRPVDDIKRYAFGANIGVGLKHQSYQLGLRASTHLGFSSELHSGAFTLRNRVVSLVFSYQL
jgi:hypothetical protein